MRLWLLTGLAGVMTAAAALGACSASNGASGSGFGGDGGNSGPGGLSGAGNGQNTGGTSSGILSNSGPSGSGTGTGAGNCNSGPNDDNDHDGWTVAQGDCNDCDPNVNPGAIEVIATMSADGGTPTPVDENCDGKIDNVEGPCDTGLALDDTLPLSGAKAIGLCHVASVDNTKGAADWSYGVITANYTHANGDAFASPGAQVGIMSAFGTNVKPQEGANMLVLSSGYARTPGQAGACTTDSCTSTKHTGTAKNPPGFPVKVQGCTTPGLGTPPVNDDVGLELKLRSPTNATGYSFKFKFYSFEYAEYVCSPFNDQFVALVDPAPMGAQSGNISFDANHNPVSVNIGFFDVCNPNSGEVYGKLGGNSPTQPNPYCPSGPGDLAGTGFDGVLPVSTRVCMGDTSDDCAGHNGKDWGGATSWLESQAPIGGGEEFTIRFTVWDSEDQNLDSTVLIDDFEWIANSGTVTVGTGKVPVPK